LPGAVYAHLDKHLSGPPITNRGRHPLPTPEALCGIFGELGIETGKQVVVYDSAAGSIGARLWWLLNYMGHEAVAVLDGGWTKWVAEGRPVTSGNTTIAPARFAGTARSEWVAAIDDVAGARILVDARDPARFRGEIEPIDPVPGHIPGAINHFWKNNLAEDGDFAAPTVIRERLSQALRAVPPETAVFYCGSGVTACHNLLAARHAGLPMPRLYAGSWSEWCKDPDRPVATGDA
jgi:thiosulfate/3-mercaptopyruvate sulfurtransferase